jgi:tricorn protease
MFKMKNIGPIVGTTTWGGLVGTWDTPRFIDGGRMVAPRGGFFDVDGNWAVEAEGVAPNIEVIQKPKSVINGNDPQLERAVQEALKLLKAQEFKIKKEPKAPIRWKRPKGYKNDN